MKKEDLLPNIVLIIATILLIVIVFFEVFTFVPSFKNSLGTLSDWFMVVITGITAIFLYKTLKSQTEVQKDQNSIYQLELKKHRLSIQPEFSFRIDGGYTWPDSETGDYYQEFDLWIKSSQPCEFKVIIVSGSHLQLSQPSKSIRHIYPTESNINIKSPNNHVYNFSDGLSSLTVGIVIDYKDREYNSYQFKSTLQIRNEFKNNQNSYILSEDIICNKYLPYKN